jgi:hypothetical protein
MEFCYDEYRGDGGWKGEYRGYFCILDGMDAEFLKLGERGINDFTCLGSAKLIKTKKGTTMAIWSDTTLLPNAE